jgi:adenine-specific DNA-methyltransferase
MHDMAIATVGEIEYGEVFTRRWVVETILDLVGYDAETDLAKAVLVEPSVGSGAFLGPIVERLVTSAARHGVPLAETAHAIRSYDLQHGHVDTCRALVADRLRGAGADAETARSLAATWVQQADFLLDDVDTQADFVVGNPPYIRADDLDDEVEAAYRRRWATMRGRSDIFIGFFERGLSLLRPGGRLGYICADRWMRNAYGSGLRQLIGERYAVQTLWQMHDVDAFETEVSAYPAITVLAKTPQAKVTVLDTTADFGPDSAVEAKQFTASDSSEGQGQGWVGARLDDWFEGPDLWPAGGPKQIRLVEDLAERFPSLEQTGGDTRIRIGVATGADKAYVVTPDADVETDRLLPLVMADDIRSGRLGTNAKVLINPWDSDGRLVDISHYPKMEKALAAHPAVQKRFVAKRNPETWYRTIDKVTPGVAAKPKLLLQDMKAQITPIYEPGGLYPHHNLYYIVSTGWDLEVLGGLLLSRIAQAFIEAYGVRMRGGTLRFQAQYLRKIRVPAPESITPKVGELLRNAYRSWDRDAATRAAEAAYGLPVGEL